MTRAPGTPAAVGRVPRGVAASALVTVVLVTMLTLVGPPAAAWSYAPGDPVSWSNGVVLCQFAPSSPSVGVSRATLAGSGVTVSVVSLVEASPNA